MPNPNEFLSMSIRFDRSEVQDAAEAVLEDEGLTLELDGGRRLRLDPKDARAPGYARVLQDLAQARRPVYIETAENDSIVRILAPLVSRVASVSPGQDGAVSFSLEDSHARYLLPNQHPEFARFSAELQGAIDSHVPLVLVLDDALELLDLREYTPHPDGAIPGLPDPRLPPDVTFKRPWWWPVERFIRYWPWWPWWWFRCVTVGHAQQAFDAVAATTCDPTTVPPPCIPFLYPEDGCWGRAHEMCRLMILTGLRPKKVWIQGALHVDTSNSPNCGVNWGWHVAPTLCVRTSWWRRKTMVIDPSLFTSPVAMATWKALQGDADASLDESSADIFYFWGASTDPQYTQSNAVLASYRNQLQLRALNIGPPPYVCP